MAKETAVILAGAVAKGAFEAGALEVLAPHVANLGITRVVGASAGALNASLFAIALRAHAERHVTTKLVELWSDAATWHNVVDFNLSDILSLKGLATADRVFDLMQRAVKGVTSTDPRPMGLSLVVTALRGNRGNIDGEAATTFERAVAFKNADFDDPKERDRMFKTALASAAFPVLFAPVEVPGVGLCIDGGAVNNGPVRLALEGSGVDRIVVITPEPLLITPPEPLSGLNLLGHVAEILINERLYRDLHDAESVNGYLNKLEQLRSDGVPSEAIDRVKGVFGWRPLEIVQIRPPEALEGNAFEAFGNHDRRLAYIEAGRKAAQAKLSRLLS
ncbi:MAG: patatin-like phospholipase family protein [Myxococcota bacterium]